MCSQRTPIKSNIITRNAEPAFFTARFGFEDSLIKGESSLSPEGNYSSHKTGTILSEDRSRADLNQ